MSTLHEQAEEIARLLEENGSEILQSSEEREVIRRLFDRTGASEKSALRFERLFPGEGPLRRELYPRHMEFFRVGARYRERCVMAGNRIGKTVAGAYESVAHLTGRYPAWWEGRRFDEPVDWWMAGKKNETTKDIIQDLLFGGVRKNERGRNELTYTGMVPRAWMDPDSAPVFKTGFPELLRYVSFRYRDSRSEFSRLGFKAYEQGRGAFEGTAKHGVWMDEEPPIDVYNECLIRTGTVDGLMILTFTPMEGMSDTVVQFLEPHLRPPEEGMEFEGQESV